MTGPGRRFDPAELLDDGTRTAAEVLDTADIARELELVAGRDAGAGEHFTDRVMAAIATEPTPQPTIAFGLALRAGRARAALGAIGDSFRVAFSGGRPLAVRGQALALVLVVLVGVLGTGGGAAIGAARLLAPDATPTPTPTQEPTPSPTPEPLPSPTPSPSPTVSPTPTDTVEPTETAEPTGTDDGPEATDDSSGSGSGSGSNSGSGSDDSGDDRSGSDDTVFDDSGVDRSGSDDPATSGSSGSGSSGSDDTLDD
jgi:hypothetical protein